MITGISKWLLCLALLSGCDEFLPLPLHGHTPPPATPAAPLNIITAGQSNMTLRINGEGIPTYFLADLKNRGIPANESNVAVGNTSIDNWIPGGSLYAAMVEAGRKQGRTDLLIFWQGEDEARSNDMVRAPAWGQKFRGMVQQLRLDLNQPDLKIIFCQIGPEPTIDGSYSTWQIVKDQQSAIYLPNVRMVKTDDQDFEGWLHTGEAGYRAIADRIVAVYLTQD